MGPVRVVVEWYVEWWELETGSAFSTHMHSNYNRGRWCDGWCGGGSCHWMMGEGPCIERNFLSIIFQIFEDIFHKRIKSCKNFMIFLVLSMALISPRDHNNFTQWNLSKLSLLKVWFANFWKKFWELSWNFVKIVSRNLVRMFQLRWISLEHLGKIRIKF